MKSPSTYSKKTNLWVCLEVTEKGTLCFGYPGPGSSGSTLLGSNLEDFLSHMGSYEEISRTEDTIVFRYVGPRCAPRPFRIFQRIEAKLPDELVVELF